MKGRAQAVAASLAALVLAAGVAADSHSAFAAYLVAWIAVSAIPIGALGVLMMTYLVRRAWTERLHATLVAATSTLAIMALLFLPVLLGMTHLYPAATSPDGLPAFKAVWLSPWFFVPRSVFYFVVLWLLGRWQRLAWGDSERMVRAASAGLIVYALLVSFAGVDWMESLEPPFHSSIYGLLFLCFNLLDGVAFPIAGALFVGQRIGSTKGYSALLLSTILLWAYMHAMQYIVIWAGNIPDEATWYLKRSSGGWQLVLVVLTIGQFVFPFFALLSSRIRTDRRWLLLLCGLTLVMRAWEASILILPATDQASPLSVGLMLLAALVFIAAVFEQTFTAALRNGTGSARANAQGVRAEAGGR